MTTYVTKIHRQHNSMVTTVPIEVRIRLGLTNGDHLVWQVDSVSNFVQISKLVPGARVDVRDKGNSNRKDTGG